MNDHDRNYIHGVLSAVAMTGMVPGGASILFAVLGIFGLKKKIHGLVLTQLIFNIVLVVAHLVSNAVLTISALAINGTCMEWEQSCGCDIVERSAGFCGSFRGSMWGTVAFGALCIVFNLACSITGCMIACGDKGNMKNTPAVANGQMATAQGIPVAKPVQ